jgi:uncharacterized protein HemX
MNPTNPTEPGQIPVPPVPVSAPIPATMPLTSNTGVSDQPEAPNAAAIALANSLKEAATTEPSRAFQPFSGQKHPKKGLIIALIIIIAGLGAAGYFGWQYWQSIQPVPAANVEPAPEPAEEEMPVTAQPIGDTETSVNEAITDMQTELDAMDTSDYEESSLSDQALTN